MRPRPLMAMLMLGACATSFIVRPLSVFDFAATAPLLADSFEPTAVGPLQRPAAIFKQSVGLQKRLGATTQLVACDRTDAVCGYVELWNSEFLEGRSIRGWHHEPPDAYVSSLAVATSHRRRGVATALMQAAEEQYLSEGRESISLQVEVANQPAVSLYQSLGYETIGRDERAVYGGIQFEARLALRKQLSQATSSSSSTPATMADPPRPRASSARRVSGFTMQLGAEELSADELEVALLTEERLLLDVWAEWCGPCKLLSPEVDTLATVLAGRVRVAKFDSEQVPGGEELTMTLQVQGLPSLLFVSEGEVLHRVEGALSAARIAELVEGVWFGAEMPRGPEYGDFS